MVSIAKDEAERDDGLSMADARRSDNTADIANRSARSDVDATIDLPLRKKLTRSARKGCEPESPRSISAKIVVKRRKDRDVPVRRR